jgi:pimeloyl-ACP methyl ester carboxylesterase/predicted glycosyltransferase
VRALQPDIEGFIERDGVKVGYEVFGNGSPTLLLMPTWSIAPSRVWKAQVAYLARHHRVITIDPRGNGRSDRPTDPALMADGQFVDDSIQVLDVTGTEQAVLVALSMGNTWALRLAADHPSRVLGWIAIGPSISGLGARRPEDAEFDARFDQQLESPTGWELYNRHEWLHHYRRFVEFFFHESLPEPHSTKQWEDIVGWAMDTDGETLVAKWDSPEDEQRPIEEVCALVRCPVVVVHGTHDGIIPYANGKRLAELTGARMVTLEGVGHLPQARYPVMVNRLVHEFALSLQTKPAPDLRWRRSLDRRPRVLYLSSPIGLGHARRDLAIVRALREKRPDTQVEWLTQHPVTAFLRSAGESVHPASDHLASESRHLEGEAGEHDLHVFQAFRDMDEVLVANFMVLDDLVRDEHFDLIVGDEAWDLDYFLHENPELKRSPYAWLTDFVGWLPMPDGGARESATTADYNAEMVEHIARFPWLRDKALFVGNPDDIVPDRLGPDLPAIREWTEGNFDFVGYITGFDDDVLKRREELRDRFGYRPDEQVCLVSVGGSGVGGHLLRRVAAAHSIAKEAVPGLRTVLVAGPRIDPASLPRADGMDVHGFLPDLVDQMVACDVAVVQGGLTTTMELTATGRPFLYFPLQHHFEQNFHVPHRLANYGAGRRMDYAASDPEVVAAAIVSELTSGAGQETAAHEAVSRRLVETDGAARVAAHLSELF